MRIKDNVLWRLAFVFLGVGLLTLIAAFAVGGGNRLIWKMVFSCLGISLGLILMAVLVN